MSQKKLPQHLLEKLNLTAPTSSGETQRFGYYLHLAKSGHFPLFFKEWIKDYQLSVDLKSQKQSLEKFFSRIEHHHNVDRQKIALSNFSTQDRQDFINAFMGQLEYEILEQKYHLH